MRCRRLTMYTLTQSDPRDTSGPRIDRIPLVRPPKTVGALGRELKKILFRPPVRVPLISLDHKRTERYSNGCMSVPLASVSTCASCHACGFCSYGSALALEHCKLLQRSDRYEAAAEIASVPRSTLALQAQPAPAPAIQPKKRCICRHLFHS